MPRGATSPSVQKRPQRASSLRRCQRRELRAAAGDPAVGYGTASAAIHRTGFPQATTSRPAPGRTAQSKHPEPRAPTGGCTGSPGCQTAKAHSTARHNGTLSATVYQCPCQHLAPGQKSFPTSLVPAPASRPAPAVTAARGDKSGGRGRAGIPRRLPAGPAASEPPRAGTARPPHPARSRAPGSAPRPARC